MYNCFSHLPRRNKNTRERGAFTEDVEPGSGTHYPAPAEVSCATWKADVGVATLEAFYSLKPRELGAFVRVHYEDYCMGFVEMYFLESSGNFAFKTYIDFILLESSQNLYNLNQSGIIGSCLLPPEHQTPGVPLRVLMFQILDTLLDKASVSAISIFQA